MAFSHSWMFPSLFKPHWCSAGPLPCPSAPQPAYPSRTAEAYGLDSHIEAKDLPCNILGQVHWVHQKEKIHYTNRLNILALDIYLEHVYQPIGSHILWATSFKHQRSWESTSGWRPWQLSIHHWWKGQHCIAVVPRSDTVIKPLRLCHFGPESHWETVHQKKIHQEKVAFSPEWVHFSDTYEKGWIFVWTQKSFTQQMFWPQRPELDKSIPTPCYQLTPQLVT